MAAPGAPMLDARTAASGPPRLRPRKIAYLVSRFPKLTETFILDEILAMEKLGEAISVYSLQRQRGAAMHAEAAALAPRVHFRGARWWHLPGAHAGYLVRAPGAYARAAWTLLRANWGSARYFFGAVVFFPKMVEFARAMQREKVTHVHAHFASHPAAAAFVIHRLTGIPYSFTAHGSDLHRDRHMLGEKVAEAAVVVAISRDNRRQLLAECGPSCADRVAVIHCGVDTARFRPRPRDRQNGAPGASILCVGTLHEVKGQRYLLDACRLLAERGVAFRCHLVGDGPDRRAVLRQARAARLGDRLVLHGALKREKVLEMLAGCDILVAPSVEARDGRREGIPVVLMEAMACGLPVVASRLSGIPELVEHDVSGLLVPPRDAQALADSLQRLAGDPELRRRLGQQGRAKVAAEFDLARNVRLLAERLGRRTSP